MLHSLTVSNIVLIEHMTLQFGDGLTVLTGETGAGKSILLDALGLTLGSRADFALIRNDTDQAQVTANFVLARDHPANARLDEAGIATDDLLILRRRLGEDGRSRAHVNDQVANHWQTRQRTNNQLPICHYFRYRRDTSKTILAVHVYTIRSTNTFSARAPVGQRLIFLLDQIEYIQNHQVLSLWERNLDILHVWLTVRFRVIAIDAH